MQEEVVDKEFGENCKLQPQIIKFDIVVRS